MPTTTLCRPDVEVPVPTYRRAIAPPKFIMARAQEQALAESYCKAVGGQDARDVRAGKRTTHLLVLRPAARMVEVGSDPCAVLAYYQLATATVEALCTTERRSFLELSLAEQESNALLDRDQIAAGATPSRSALLNIIVAGQQQIARTMQIVAEAQRALGASV